MRGLLGIAVILVLAWALSEDRVSRAVAGCRHQASLLQFGLALLFLKFPPAPAAFLLLNRAVEALQNATEAGTGFVFGYLGGGAIAVCRDAARAPASSSPFAHCRWCW